MTKRSRGRPRIYSPEQIAQIKQNLINTIFEHQDKHGKAPTYEFLRNHVHRGASVYLSEMIRDGIITRKVIGGHDRFYTANPTRK